MFIVLSPRFGACFFKPLARKRELGEKQAASTVPDRIVLLIQCRAWPKGIQAAQRPRQTNPQRKIRATGTALDGEIRPDQRLSNTSHAHAGAELDEEP